VGLGYTPTRRTVEIIPEAFGLPHGQLASPKKSRSPTPRCAMTRYDDDERLDEDTDFHSGLGY
jgi:hypothetical protein